MTKQIIIVSAVCSQHDDWAAHVQSAFQITAEGALWWDPLTLPVYPQNKLKHNAWCPETGVGEMNNTIRRSFLYYVAFFKFVRCTQFGPLSSEPSCLTDADFVSGFVTKNVVICMSSAEVNISGAVPPRLMSWYVLLTYGHPYWRPIAVAACPDILHFRVKRSLTSHCPF
jgi:hypothetical protein